MMLQIIFLLVMLLQIAHDAADHVPDSHVTVLHIAYDAADNVPFSHVTTCCSDH